MADRLHAVLDGQPMTVREAGAAVGVQPTALRYGTPTGRIRIRWDGARQPTVWTVPAPETDPRRARLELARRYLHVFGPSTGDAFATWAGIKPAAGLAAFHGLRAELTPVRTPIGDAWILAGDQAGFDTANGSGSPAAARLLPSGDTYFLLQGDDRELLVPDAARRSALWTSRVWPGAVLLGGEIVGTWRRSEANVTIELWGELSDAERSAVVEEAESLPLPGLAGRMRVRFGAPLTSSPRPS